MSLDNQFLVTLAFAAPPIVFAITIQWATQVSKSAKYFQSFRGIVAPFFASVGVPFALFVTFLMNDIWVRVEDGTKDVLQSLEREAGALSSLHQIAVSLGDDGVAIKARVADYIEASHAEGQGAPGGGRSSSVNDSLQHIADAILHPDLSRGSHAVVQQQLLESYREIGRARADRTPISIPQRDLHKWTGMIVLGLLTQISIAMIHIENRKAAAASLFLFTSAFVVMLVVFALSEMRIADRAYDSQEIIRSFAR